MSAKQGKSRRWSYGAGLASTLLLGAVVLSRVGCAPAPATPARSPATIESSSAASRSASAGPAGSSSSAAAAEPTRGRASVANEAALVAPQSPVTASRSLAATAADLPSAPPDHAGSASPPSIDPGELRLLASIERELKRNPPPEVHALIAEHRRGAERAALISYVQTQFPPDLALRVITLRWIDDVRPGAGAGAARPKTPSVGTGPGWVKPVQQR